MVSFIWTWFILVSYHEKFYGLPSHMYELGEDSIYVYGCPLELVYFVKLKYIL